MFLTSGLVAMLSENLPRAVLRRYRIGRSLLGL